MFGLFRKKTQLEQLISKDGIEHATDRFAEIITRKLPNKEIAYQFILEELDGASKGNAASQEFAKNSGILAHEYRGALDNSRPEVDGPDGPQQLLLGLSLELMANQALMADFRCKVDDKIMRKYGLGKYSGTSQSSGNSSRKNFNASQVGYVVKDQDSGHILEVVLNGTMFHARVLIPSQDITLPLAPWPITENLFQDDNLFSGSGRLGSESWSFSIKPSSPFSEIAKQVLSLNSFHDPSAPELEVHSQWIAKLVEWADDVGLEELRWEPNARNRDGGYWVGFPRDAKKIIALEGLNVDNCGLTDLPMEIGNLKKLRTLWASGNKLTTIPNEICNLTSLEDVRFSENQINRVPEDIGNLNKLLILDLEDNLISYVPESISKLRNLERLDLRRQPVDLGSAETPLTDDQVSAIVSLGDAVRW